MKKIWLKIFLLFAIYCLVPILFIGCAAIKEAGLGVAGLSIKELENSRKDALKGKFNLGYNTCYEKVKEALLKQGSYVYTQDPAKGVLAIYVSYENTTPVGVFFTKIDLENTLIEISSQSVCAKELIGKRVFSCFSDKVCLEKKGEN